MKNKKWILLLLAIIFVFAVTVAACTPEDDEDDVLTGEYAVDMDIPANTGTFDDYTLQKGENERQVVIYWRESAHSYADNDIWLWYDNVDGRAYEFHTCEYGAKVIVNVPSSVTQVGFIVRKDTKNHGTSWDDAGKVYEKDRFATLYGDVTEVYLTGTNAHQFISEDGGVTLKIMKLITKMTVSGMDMISFGVAPSVKITKIDKVKVTSSDGKELKIKSVSTLNKSASMGDIIMNEKLDLSKEYTVSIDGFGEKKAIPMEVFDSAEFVSAYTYDGNDLGATVNADGVMFKLWAPTASKVTLNVFDAGSGGSAKQTVDMTKGDKGVWSIQVNGAGHKTYYTYTVTTSAGTQEAVDPYAKSAGVNGERGMVVDFAQTNPEGFDKEKYITLDSYTDAVLWETHVRDFSNKITSSQYKGKFLAFTETGLTNSHGISVGVDYVKSLGVTHIHLLPIFDYKSVDETNGSQFNWGYDPQNYNVLEGSYSTDPSKGEVRINEFKQAVQALHAQGLGVVMDVVYNHTYDANSNLNKIVPNYYYRYNADGTNSSGSGCGNDTASERLMFRKYMIDSVKYWMSEYKLDGFRFDLMGLHDVDTMNEIEKAVHAINPNAVIYGEGWTMSTATNSALATQGNIDMIKGTQGAAGSIAVFNDVIRDGLRGSVFNAAEQGYLGNPLAAHAKDKVIFGLTGSAVSSTDVSSWSVKNANVINYISAHDNNTLYDKLKISCPNATEEQIIAMNKLGAAIVMLSKGTPFMQAGEEILRSKVNADGTYNENSYNASDEVNNIKWESLTLTSNEYKTYLYYKGLIAIRKSNVALTDRNSVVSIGQMGATPNIAVTFTSGNNKVIAVINASGAPVSYSLPQGNWSLLANGEQAGTEPIDAVSGTVNVAAKSVGIFCSAINRT